MGEGRGSFDWVVPTRLHPPGLREDFLSRPQLVGMLSRGEPKLVLVSAPAGYGKTTLLSCFAAQREGPLAWLSLEREDNDPVRFLISLLAAIREASPTLVSGTVAALRGGGPLPALLPRCLRALAHDLARGPELVLVLDDLHLIGERAVFEALDYLIAHLPASKRLVVGTREDPPLPLPRLRSRGELLELRAAELRFSLEETARFLSALDLPPQDIAALDRQVEGWPAGLRLIRQALARLPWEGRSPFIRDLSRLQAPVFDYLAQEVLGNLPQDLEAFLLATSVLPQLTPALCAAVSGREDAGELLERLYRGNAFLTRSSSDPFVFRYHALFSQFLRRRLADTGKLAELHLLAAAAQEDPAQAIQHLLFAGAWEKAADRIQEVGEEWLRRGLHVTVEGWIQGLPEELRTSRPELLHLLGVCAWQRGEPLAALRALEGALAAYEAAGDRSGQARVLTDLVPPLIMAARYRRVEEVSRHALAGEMAPKSRVQVLMVLGIAAVTHDRCPAAGQYLSQALAISEEADDPDTWAAQAIHCMSQFTVLPGAIDQVERICSRAMDLFPHPCPASMAAQARYALVHLLRGRLAEAISSGERALAMGEEMGGVSYLDGEAAWTLVQANIARGDREGTMRALGLARRFFHQFPHGEAALSTLDFLAGLSAYLVGGVGELRRHWMQLSAVRRPGEWAVVETLREMLFCLVCLAEGHRRGLEGKLLKLVKFQAEVPTSTRFLSARALLAHLYLLQGRREAARREYTGFLAECRRQGMPGRPLLEGPLAVPLLRPVRGDEAPLAARLLAVLEAGGPLPVPDTGSTLTPREVEVLRLLAQGKSNRELAHSLGISEGTVKLHVHHILRKLGTRSRTQAALRARELGLV